MQRVQLLHLVPLFLMLAWASVQDLRSRRIRNWLTLSMILLGLAQSFTPGHTTTPGNSLLGFAAGFGLTFVLFAMGALGGGDVKLMAGVGAWLGPAPTLCVFAIQALFGMVIVLAQAAWQRRLAALFHNSMLLLVNVAHVRELGIEHVTATGQSSRSVSRPLPYAVPVFLAVASMAIQSYITHGS